MIDWTETGVRLTADWWTLSLWVGLSLAIPFSGWVIWRAWRRQGRNTGDLPAPSFDLVATWMGTSLSVRLTLWAVIVGFGLLFLLAFGASFRLVFAVAFQPPEAGTASLGLGALLVALLGAPFLIWRSVVAQRTVDVAQDNFLLNQQGQVTKRITEAVAALGTEKVVKRQRKNSSGALLYEGDGNDLDLKKPVFEEVSVPNMEVRFGGIYALGRIARENPDFHLEVVEILCSYVRENAPLPVEAPSIIELWPRPRADIQAVISVLGKRSNEQIEKEFRARYRLNLGASDLRGCNFEGMNFSAANFSDCRLDACWMRYTDLTGSIFFRAILNYGDFWHAKMVGTRFDGAVYSLPSAQPGGMVSGIAEGDWRGVCLAGADLSGINYLGDENQLRMSLGTKDTILHHDALYEFMPDELGEKRRQMRHFQKIGNDQRAEELRAELERSGLQNWVEFNRSDLAFGYKYREFMEELSLTGWPYFDK